MQRDGPVFCGRHRGVSALQNGNASKKTLHDRGSQKQPYRQVHLGCKCSFVPVVAIAITNQGAERYRREVQKWCTKLAKGAEPMQRHWVMYR